MTRWLAVLSVVALSAGALQARADVLPTEDGGATCGGYGGSICEKVSVSKCTQWRGERFEVAASGKGVNVQYDITCANWNTVTTTTYYPK